jgi:hypothetical protein
MAEEFKNKTVWVGCCSGCGEVQAAFMEDGLTCEERAQKVGELVIRGLKVGWTVQQVTIGRCRCNAWKGPGSADGE